MRIENCVVSRMGNVGIYHTASGAEVIVLDTVVRDNIDGVGLAASLPRASGAEVRVSANNGAGFMQCLDGATMISLGNNAVYDVSGACLSTGSGF